MTPGQMYVTGDETVDDPKLVVDVTFTGFLFASGQRVVYQRAAMTEMQGAQTGEAIIREGARQLRLIADWIESGMDPGTEKR